MKETTMKSDTDLMIKNLKRMMLAMIAMAFILLIFSSGSGQITSASVMLVTSTITYIYLESNE